MNEVMEKEDIVIVDEKTIKDKLYYIRGKYVMIDKDLAEIYGYSTKSFNQQVKNNIERFDEDFRFQLSSEEVKILSRSKNLTLNNQSRGYNIKYNPYAFTEEGVAMLATILKSSVAVKVSIRIMDAFVAMRHYIGEKFNNIVLIWDSINIFFCTIDL